MPLTALRKRKGATATGADVDEVAVQTRKHQTLNPQRRGRDSIVGSTKRFRHSFSRPAQVEILLDTCEIEPQTPVKRPFLAPASKRPFLAPQVEILLDTYEIEVESLATKLTLLLREIESSEDVLNLRLENVQKNTFLANAFFHMVTILLFSF